MVRGRRQIGKSRLVAEFCAHAGVPVLVSTASRHGSVRDDLGWFAADAARESDLPVRSPDLGAFLAGQLSDENSVLVCWSPLVSASSPLSFRLRRGQWAARDRIRTQEQREVAALANVKLRLGRLNGNNQIDRTDGKGFNQSEELVLDADQLVALGKSQLTPMFALRSPATAPVIGVATDQPDTAASTNGLSARAAAAAFTRDWLDAAIEAELADLHARRPRIPRPLDLELLTAVERALGQPLLDDETARRAARSAFWGVINSAVSSLTPTD